MNVGVLKLGGRLTWAATDKTGGIGEAKAICELIAMRDSNTVNVYTKVLDKEQSFENPQNIFVHDISFFDEIKDDVLLVFNGNVNFFGGAEAPDQIRNYILMNRFKGKIFYIYIDPELQLKQIYKSIESKDWGSKYSRDDLEVTRKDIEVITSMYDKSFRCEKFKKSRINVNKFHFFPFEKYPLINNIPLRLKKNPKYDLIYMGTFRGGKRQDKMIKYYFGHEGFNTTFIGKTKLKDFKKNYSEPVPKFLPAVPFDKIRYEINNSLAHVCIGDKAYDGRILTPRIYESMLFGTVCLIDAQLDPTQLVFGMRPFLQKFNYVWAKSDVHHRVTTLKREFQLRQDILGFQYSIIHQFNVQEYHNDFMKILGS